MKKGFYDVAIIGGGIIGSSIACFLATNRDFKGSVLIIEKHPAYFYSSTTLSVGGIRQQFSVAENIEISKFGIEFIKNSGDLLAANGDVPDVYFTEKGYLFLATEKGKETLLHNYDLQKKHNVNVEMLSNNDLKRKFPWLSVGDLIGGCFGIQDEGFLDPYILLKAFINKSKTLGVEFIKDEVVSIKREKNAVTQIELKGGDRITCGNIVNASGASASQVSKMAGITNFPVESRKRNVFVFRCNNKIENCPMVIDPSGVYFRPEGKNFLCGVSPPADQDPESFDFEVTHSMFEEHIWPILAERVEIFDAIRCEHSWAGHYAYNIHDQNAILGFHPEIKNFVFANGFSGHGLQQAPAVGRAISELFTYGNYTTLDLSRLNYSRFKENNLLKEINVV